MVPPPRQAEAPPVRSPLDLEAVHDLIRDRKEQDLKGQSFEWTFSEASPFLWSPYPETGPTGTSYLSVRGRKDAWFAVEIREGDETWSLDRLESRLGGSNGKVWGAWAGIHRAAPTGPEWSRLKRVPLLRPLELEWTEKEAPHSEPSGSIRIESDPFESSPYFDTNGDPGSEAPLYRVAAIRRGSLDVDSDFERYSPWSLTHLLYFNGEWLLSAADYERVEEWDRRIRNRFETFESPEVRQAVVADFIRLLGYSKARRVGIVFNDEDGIPSHRWVPDTLHDRQEGAEGGLPADASEEANLAQAMTTLLEGRREETPLQQQLLAMLFAEGKSIQGGGLQRTRQDWVWIRPSVGGRLFDESQDEGAFPAIRNLLDLSEAEELIFRVGPVWFEQIENRFGPAESLRTDPYPRPIPAPTGSVSEAPKVSMVWHVYGGVRVGKPNSLVEGADAPPDLAVVAIDVAKWRRLNRPTGLARSSDR